jgi:DNA (cytosine-5)-methyltransferase 1
MVRRSRGLDWILPMSATRSQARGRNVAPDLWPPFRRLISACRPGVVFGEQVAAARAWLDGVCDDMEGMGYAFGAAVLPACSVGLDHVGERLYFAGAAYGQSQSSGAFDAEVARLSRAHCDAGNMVPPDGLSDRVALLRGFGNAIVPQVAAAFIEAASEVLK